MCGYVTTIRARISVKPARCYVARRTQESPSLSTHYSEKNRLLFFFFLIIRRPPRSTLFPSPPLFRPPPSRAARASRASATLTSSCIGALLPPATADRLGFHNRDVKATGGGPGDEHDLAREGRRSEEHTSELQSRLHLVCRLLLEKKKK